MTRGNVGEREETPCNILLLDFLLQPTDLALSRVLLFPESIELVVSTLGFPELVSHLKSVHLSQRVNTDW